MYTFISICSKFQENAMIVIPKIPKLHIMLYVHLSIPREGFLS